MSAITTSASALSGWRVIVIAVVGVLSVGIGASAGGFLLTAQNSSLGEAARYVPADAPAYVELELEPSEAQDAALRELLGRFPPIEGLDLDRPLHDQLVERFDEMLADKGETELSWSEDVAPWLDGHVAFAATDLNFAAMPDPTDPMAAEPPDMLVVAGVTDAEAARAAIERATAETGANLSETEHRGVTIQVVDESDGGAFAVSEDALLAGPDVASVQAALDTAAQGGSLADSEVLAGLAALLPADRLGLAWYDGSRAIEAMAQSGDEAAASVLRSLMEGQPLQVAASVSARGDGFTFDTVAPAPTGAFAVENGDRGLAAEVPGDALFFADGDNVGGALTAYVEAAREAAATEPEAEEQIAMAEAALGADLEELVSWIDDGALAIGWDGSAPYAGMVLVPNDVAAAERRLGQIATFANLAAMDPSVGVTVDEETIAGATVTTIRWEDPNAVPGAAMPVPTGVVVQYTVTEDRALIGFGDGFVPRVLELDEADSLAEQPRFADTVAELGGSSNVGTTWMDIRGTRTALEKTLLPLAEAFGGVADYEAQVQPWLEPLDRLAGVARIEDGYLVTRAVLLVE